MTAVTTIEPPASLALMLRALKLPTVARHAEEVARLAEREGWTFERYVHQRCAGAAWRGSPTRGIHPAKLFVSSIAFIQRHSGRHDGHDFDDVGTQPIEHAVPPIN